MKSESAKLMPNKTGLWKRRANSGWLGSFLRFLFIFLFDLDGKTCERYEVEELRWGWREGLVRRHRGAAWSWWARLPRLVEDWWNWDSRERLWRGKRSGGEKEASIDQKGFKVLCKSNSRDKFWPSSIPEWSSWSHHPWVSSSLLSSESAWVVLSRFILQRVHWTLWELFYSYSSFCF